MHTKCAKVEYGGDVANAVKPEICRSLIARAMSLVYGLIKIVLIIFCHWHIRVSNKLILGTNIYPYRPFRLAKVDFVCFVFFSLLNFDVFFFYEFFNF